MDAVESSQVGVALFVDSLLRDRQWTLLSPPKLAMPYVDPLLRDRQWTGDAPYLDPFLEEVPPFSEGNPVLTCMEWLRRPGWGEDLGRLCLTVDFAMLHAGEKGFNEGCSLFKLAA